MRSNLGVVLHSGVYLEGIIWQSQQDIERDNEVHFKAVTGE